MTWRLLSTLAAALVMTLAVPASEAFARCCGASCCLIDTVCYATGEANPEDACQVCDPSSAGTAWTDLVDCPGDVDAGMSMDEDAGMSTDEDAGTSAGEDAGSSGGTDAGSSGGTDAGSSGGTDAGSGDDSGSDDDGGCAAGGSGTFGGLFALLVLGLRRKKGMVE